MLTEMAIVQVVRQPAPRTNHNRGYCSEYHALRVIRQDATMGYIYTPVETLAIHDDEASAQAVADSWNANH